MDNINLQFYIVSQIFGILTLASFFTAMQIKNKTNHLIFMASGSIFGSAMYFFLGMQFLSSIWFIGFFRSLSFAWVNSNREKIPKNISLIVLMFFVSVLIITTAITFQSWIDWAIITVSLGNVVTAWMKGYIHLMRFFIILKAIFVIIVNINNNAVNIMGIIIELNYLIGIIIFYIRYFKNYYKNKENSK